MRYLLAAALALVVAVPASYSSASASRTQTYSCASIERLGLEKQVNAHAAQVLATCGRASASGPSLDTPFSSLPLISSAPANYGGVDVDVVGGGEGVYPHVTQSESQTWSNGTTVVMAYNDSRTAPVATRAGRIR